MNGARSINLAVSVACTNGRGCTAFQGSRGGVSVQYGDRGVEPDAGIRVTARVRGKDMGGDTWGGGIGQRIRDNKARVRGKDRHTC